ncbi:MAG: hypothetical protein HY472_01225 [Candidatus Sungbacteria bacterium]|nr:hypothetical protein [Candidatus Sungbacteria bacterium]
MEATTVGIPTNEKVYDAVYALLTKAGISIEQQPKHFFMQLGDLLFVFARLSEIVRLTVLGYINCSFVTKDYWFEVVQDEEHLTRARVLREFPKLCRCELCFVSRGLWYASNVKEGGIANLLIGYMGLMLKNPVVATRFPTLTKKFLYDRGLKPDLIRENLGELMKLKRELGSIRIEQVQGSEELSVLLKYADVAVARVESGETLRNHDLWIVDRMLTSHLLVVGQDSPRIRDFLSLIR